MHNSSSLSSSLQEVPFYSIAMRALSLRGVTLFNRAAVSSLVTGRALCSSKTETKEDAKKVEGGEDLPMNEESFRKLHVELNDAKTKIDELKQDVLYRAADADNARRIGREDVEKAKLYGISSFGKDILEVADTLEKGVEAFSSIPEEQLRENKHLNSICTGVKLSIKVLQKNLSKHGIEKMNVTLGTTFDPNLHDAIVQMPSSDKTPSGSIAHVLKDGYTIKSRILRAAQVGVASDDVSN